jgi:protein-disulfide isomerase
MTQTDDHVAAHGSAPPPRRSTSIVAPFLALVAVIALAFAAFGGGGTDGTAAGDTGTGEAATGAGDASAAAPGGSQAERPSDQAQEQAQVQTDEVRAALEALATREADDPRALGDADAPVVMLQFADFQCPFCRQFAQQTEPALIERYVDTGVMRIEWRDLPYQGEEAHLLAVAGQAAAQQGAFWAFHEVAFEADLRRGDGRGDVVWVTDLAGQLGLDVERFVRDLDDPELAAAVDGELALGRTLGITGTPAFLIGGRPVMGAQPMEVFEQVIELAAAEAAAAGASVP